MKNNLFDSQVQVLKNKVFREVAKAAWNDDLEDIVLTIPKKIIPKNVPTMRCCVYKERAILAERISLALKSRSEFGGNVVKVIDIACEECPMAGYEITSLCRGCLAHHCQSACKKDAIYLDKNHVAHINKNKCVECGQCATACPYKAIINRVRPCQDACKVNAISTDENGAAIIDDEKCIRCGQCLYKCPFGAIVDETKIVKAINIIKNSDNNKNYKVHAIIAPAIAGQFGTNINKIVAALKKLGLYSVHEVAKGADMVAIEEAKELKEKGMLLSSCCPSFVRLVKTSYPELSKYLSECLSPMNTLAKKLKEEYPGSKVIFVGPCTAKKDENYDNADRRLTSCVITLEELKAICDSKKIAVGELEDVVIDEATSFGRNYGSSGGVAAAIKQGLLEIGADDFEYKPLICNGTKECIQALERLKAGTLKENFIEGMACEGGCVNGAGCLKHSPAGASLLNKHAQLASHKTILSALNEKGTD